MSRASVGKRDGHWSKGVVVLGKLIQLLARRLESGCVGVRHLGGHVRSRGHDRNCGGPRGLIGGACRSGRGRSFERRRKLGRGGRGGRQSAVVDGRDRFEIGDHPLEGVHRISVLRGRRIGDRSAGFRSLGRSQSFGRPVALSG